MQSTDSPVFSPVSVQAFFFYEYEAMLCFDVEIYELLLLYDLFYPLSVVSNLIHFCHL